MTDDESVSFDFQKEELPHRLEPYAGAAADSTQEEFARRFSDPFLLFRKTALWDPLLLLARQDAGFSGCRTAIASFVSGPGGVSFISPIKKRKTDASAPNIILGRHKSNDIVVPISSVSARHCQFLPRADDEPWTVADLGTKNGSFINDARMVPSQPYDLSDGVRLEFGDVVTYFFAAAALWEVFRDPARIDQLLDSGSDS